MKKRLILLLTLVALTLLAVVTVPEPVQAWCSGDNCDCGIEYYVCAESCEGDIACLRECSRANVRCARDCCGN